eukprot:GHRR01008917.1.p1 GENE.GHRR01008917.1~~GHRR01008917.1.p1  ORF type:complete len:366 (+),score=88.67 GHRR01008917.1:967-2064(+)
MCGMPSAQCTRCLLTPKPHEPSGGQTFRATHRLTTAGFIATKSPMARAQLSSLLSGVLRPLHPSVTMHLVTTHMIVQQAQHLLTLLLLNAHLCIGGDGDFLHVRETKASLQDVVVNGLLQPKERGSHMGKHIVTGTVHRVAIYDAQFRLINIISQTDIIKFLYMNQQDIGDLSKQTAAELGWAQTMVVSVGPEVSAIEAMRLMNERQISAVAVVDGVGKIIGNFSVSEMRTIMAEHFGALALPVAEFLALEHGTEFQGYSRIQEHEVTDSKGHRFVTDRVARTRPRTPGEEVGQSLVLVKPAAPLTEILGKIVNHRIHRVYVVDDQERPCGVITCTDILRLVIKAAQDAEQQQQHNDVSMQQAEQ